MGNKPTCHRNDLFTDAVSDGESGFVRANFMQTWQGVRNQEAAAALLDLGRDPDFDLTAWQQQRVGAVDAMLAEHLGREKDGWKNVLAIHDTLQAWRRQHGRKEEHAAAAHALATAWAGMPCIAGLAALSRRPGGVQCVAEALCSAAAAGRIGPAAMTAILGAEAMRPALCAEVASAATWIAVAATLPPAGMWAGTVCEPKLQEAARAPFMQQRLDRFVDSLPDRGRAGVLAFARQRAAAWRAAMTSLSSPGKRTPIHAAAPSAVDAASMQKTAMLALRDIDLLRRSLAIRAAPPEDFATCQQRIRHDIPSSKANNVPVEIGFPHPDLEKLLRAIPDLVCGLALVRQAFSDPEVIRAAPLLTRTDTLHVFTDYFAALLQMEAPVERLAMALPPQAFCDTGTGASPSFVEDYRRTLDEMWLAVLRHRDCTPQVLASAGVAAGQASLPVTRAALDAARLTRPSASARPRLRS